MAKHTTPPFSWEQAFTKAHAYPLPVMGPDPAPVNIDSIAGLKTYLDWVHVKHCLLRPYFEQPDYPLVESRELLPSFESDLFEHSSLPGFSMVAFARPLDYFEEVFQFDILHTLLGDASVGLEKACPLENTVRHQNIQAFLDRLPKAQQESFRRKFARRDVTDMEAYPEILDYLLQMDRAHVASLDHEGNFFLSGVYASLPSDLDTEIKRFGLRIKKFALGDNVRYELYRIFVYRFLMELYGFPIVSERRTSAALFARRLFRMGEDFLVRVLGQSDRTLTTIYRHKGPRRYPRVEKIALVRVDAEQREARTMLGRGRYFVDRDRHVVILRVVYRQHAYDPNNVQQDRALSVLRQEVIHPLTGRANGRVNIIKDTTNMVLRLNDIVRGEYNGRVVYKRNEVVQNTDTDEKRLKFLYAWLSKHQRRIIGYSDEFYANVIKVLDHYLLDPERYDVFDSLKDLHHEVWSKYSYIRQARKAKHLEDLANREVKQVRIGYLDMLEMANAVLADLKFEIVHYFDSLVTNVIAIGEDMLQDTYLVRTYIAIRDDDLTNYGRDIKRQYGRLVSHLDEFKAIRHTRKDTSQDMGQVV